MKGKLLTNNQLLSLMQIIAFSKTTTLKRNCNSYLQFRKHAFHEFHLKHQKTISEKQFLKNLPATKIKHHIMNNSNKCETTKMDHRQLAIFDFDYTVVACNTDTVVRDLLPPDKLTKEVNDIIDTNGWTAYMAEIFRLLREQRCSKAKIMDTIRAIPEVPGFVRLLKRLHQNYNFDMIIISDSNSVFIDEWLQAHGLGDSFLSVFTNPANFDETGMLNIQPYHPIGQTECKLSAPNLCKGRVMTKFVIEQDLKNRIQYDRVLYVGDGSNDICPVLRLRPCDFACARQGFSLEKLIAKTMEKNELQCDAIIWRNGFDLLEQLETKLQLKRAGGFY